MVLFNVSRTIIMENLKEKAIKCSSQLGPSFGSNELSASSEPFNKDNAIISEEFCIFNSLYQGNNINLFENQNGGSFTITELEVWGVVPKKYCIYELLRLDCNSFETILESNIKINNKINYLSHHKIFRSKIEPMNTYRYRKFKGIIIGDYGVGKTSILRNVNSYDLKYGG